MQNKEKKLFNVSSFEEAYKLHIEKKLIIPCGGTTGIFRVKRENFEGFINLKYCNLSYINQQGSILTIGALTTFNELIEYLKNRKNYY